MKIAKRQFYEAVYKPVSNTISNAIPPLFKPIYLASQAPPKKHLLFHHKITTTQALLLVLNATEDSVYSIPVWKPSINSLYL